VKFFKIVFTILGIIFTINIIQSAVEYNIRQSVYACEEVTKADPIDVQKICERRWRRK
jgi:hypothetical protein